MSIGTPEEVHEIRLKHERPIGSKDVTLRKRRTQISIGTPEEVHEIRLKRGRPFFLIKKKKGLPRFKRISCTSSGVPLKSGRPIGSKDVTLRKRKTQMSIGTPEEVHDNNNNNSSSSQG